MFQFDNILCDYVRESKEILNSDSIDYDRLNELIKENYESDDTDIEDLDDMIMLLNSHLFKNLENGELSDKIKNNKLLDLRLLAKKYSNRKYREGMLYLYPEQSNNYKKYGDEKPRDFFEVDSVHYQYMSLLNYTWKPSIARYKEYLEKIN